ITECCAAIKSFNGGVVTVKDCYFWDNFETPCQGEVKVLGMIPSAPSPEVIAAAGGKKRAPAAGRGNKEELKIGHEALAQGDLSGAYHHFQNVTPGRPDDDLVPEAREAMRRIGDAAARRVREAGALEAIGEKADAIA